MLIAVARGLESALRARDAVARWGGEESLLVFRTRSDEPATERAESARRRGGGTTAIRRPATMRTATLGLAAHAR